VQQDGRKQPPDMGAGYRTSQSLGCAGRGRDGSEHAGTITVRSVTIRRWLPTLDVPTRRSAATTVPPASAPVNTIAGIDALLAGADAVELDVRRAPGGQLVLADDRRGARRSWHNPSVPARAYSWMPPPCAERSSSPRPSSVVFQAAPPRRGGASRAAAAQRQGLAELVTVHRSLVAAQLVSTVHAADGEVYLWDVGNADQAGSLGALG
jgi:hypothetical protein